MTAFTGKQKAALLLASLDVATAAEFLKGVDPTVIKDLTVEVAYLEACGLGGIDTKLNLIQEFNSSLHGDSYKPNDFLNEMLNNSVGKEKAQQIQGQIKDLLHKKDPFIPIRSGNPETIAIVLENEHPQAGAIVLAELSEKHGPKVLSLLSDQKRLQIVSRMAVEQAVSPQIKHRVAQMVLKRVNALPSDSVNSAQTVNPVRKTAVVLRNLSKEIADGLIASIGKTDNEMAQNILKQMVIWEDIPIVADMSLQVALREVDSSKLALALYEADSNIANKIRANISERASATIDEEIELMSMPKPQDIQTSRDAVVASLAALNEKGDLAFIEQ